MTQKRKKSRLNKTPEELDRIVHIRLFKSLLVGKKSIEWKRLSPSAKIFYLSLKAHFNGQNNGRICFTYASAKGNKGIAAPKTFIKAQRELIKSGWITVQSWGGKNRRANHYTLTGKHDHCAIKPEIKLETKPEEDTLKEPDFKSLTEETDRDIIEELCGHNEEERPQV